MPLTENGVFNIVIVTQCQPEDTHGEFKPSNRNELLPKNPPFHAKGEKVN